MLNSMYQNYPKEKVVMEKQGKHYPLHRDASQWLNCPHEIASTFEWLVFQTALGHKVVTPKNDKWLKYKPMFETEYHKTIYIASNLYRRAREAIDKHVEAVFRKQNSWWA